MILNTTERSQSEIHEEQKAAIKEIAAACRCPRDSAWTLKMKAEY
jgi:hypothetical protein